jgi:hypothetical protein
MNCSHCCGTPGQQWQAPGPPTIQLFWAKAIRFFLAHLLGQSIAFIGLNMFFSITIKLYIIALNNRAMMCLLKNGCFKRRLIFVPKK